MVGGKYKDEWVVDRTMFEFVNGSGCACCGMTNLFLPGGLKGMIESISDLETDAASAELKAAERSPWPPNLRDDVWANRVRLRHKMKKEMKDYEDFFLKNDRSKVESWCREDVGTDKLAKIFQLPRSEIAEIIKTKYGIHFGFSTVLNAVTEQVAHFKKTKYETDGRCPEEIAFEKTLVFSRMTGFTLPIKTSSPPDDPLTIFLNFMVTLGGPKLLTRGPSKSANENDETGADDPADDPYDDSPVGKTGPSFRADRRIIRLLIGRYWADQIISKFKSAHPLEEKLEKQDNIEEES